MVVTLVPTVLVTGANGFIGANLCPVLEQGGFSVRRAVRRDDGQPNTFATDKINGSTDWKPILDNVYAVVHLAARVHVLLEHDDVPQVRFRRTNVEASHHLAEQAAAAGVKRFVFVSTIGVHGVKTQMQGFCELDSPAPLNEYASSKLEAEQALREVSEKTGMEIVIIRPPLVYGPGVKANFLKLMQIVDKGIPLPLASIHNKRDILYVGNLADAILKALTHPKAAGEAFVVADGQPVSTPELIRAIARHLDKPARIFPFPPALLELAGRIFGKCDTVHRLAGSLEVDTTKIKRTLDWTPPHRFDDGLEATVKWYKQHVEN